MKKIYKWKFLFFFWYFSNGKIKENNYFNFFLDFMILKWFYENMIDVKYKFYKFFIRFLINFVLMFICF